MAQHESDREDLMRDAVALVVRAEMSVDGFEEVVTAGFRANNALSIFVGQDPVYQFDPEGRLRRAYVDGFLYRSQHETLAKMHRIRTEHQTVLSRVDLSADERAEFCDQMHQCLRLLLSALQDGKYQVLRSVPETHEWSAPLIGSLQSVLSSSPWLSSQIQARR